MKAARYWRFAAKDQPLAPIYYEGPFWAHWLCTLFSRTTHLSLDLLLWVEDRWLSPVGEDAKKEAT